MQQPQKWQRILRQRFISGLLKTHYYGLFCARSLWFTDEKNKLYSASAQCATRTHQLDSKFPLAGGIRANRLRFGSCLCNIFPESGITPSPNLRSYHVTEATPAHTDSQTLQRAAASVPCKEMGPFLIYLIPLQEWVWLIRTYRLGQKSVIVPPFSQELRVLCDVGRVSGSCEQSLQQSFVF